MKNLLALALLALCCAPASHAQTAADEYPRFEFNVGYTHSRFDFNRHTTPGAFTEPDGLPVDFGRGGLHGLDVSATYNVTRRVGLLVNLLVFGKNERLDDLLFCRRGDPRCDPCVRALSCPDGPVDFVSERRLYEVLAGAQFRDNSLERHVKPFARVSAGVARINQLFIPRDDDPDGQCGLACSPFSFNRTAFALDVGGGLDVRLGSRVDLRVFQLGYNPTFAGGGAQHNLRAGVGLGFH